jgi:hypothetical protein
MNIASFCPASIALRRCANLGSTLKLTVSSAASPGRSLKLDGMTVYLSLLLILTSPSTEALAVFVTRTGWECTCSAARAAQGRFLVCCLLLVPPAAAAAAGRCVRLNT